MYNYEYDYIKYKCTILTYCLYHGKSIVLNHCIMWYIELSDSTTIITYKTIHNFDT